MSNQLTRIEREADEYVKKLHPSDYYGSEAPAYIAGATAATNRAAPLLKALDLAEMELKAMYKRLGFTGSNVLSSVTEALEKYKSDV